VLATLTGVLLARVGADVGGDLSTYLRLLGVALGVGLLLPVVAARSVRAAAVAVAALGGGWVLVQLLYAVLGQVEMLPPVGQAVGAAAYFGTSYVPIQVASVLALGLVLAAALIVRRRHGAVAAAPAEPAGAGSVRAAVVVTALVWLTLLPNISHFLFGLQPVGWTWDVANLLVWNSFIERGLQPIGDFFYPYGHLWLFEPTPWGPVLRWLAQALLLALTAWSMWHLTGRRPVRVGLALVALAVLLTWSPLTIDRYYPAFVIPLVYAALGPAAHRRLTHGHAVLAFAVLYAGWLELDLVLMGAAGVVFIIAGQLVAGRLGGPLRDAVRRLAVDAVPFLAVLVAPVVWLAEGTLEENWRFWRGLRAASAGAASDLTQFATQLDGFVPTFFSLAVAIPVLFLVAGLVLARRRVAGAHAASMVFLAGAGTSEILLLKHLVRPAPELMYVLVFPVLLFAVILLWDRRALVMALLAGLVAGSAWVALQIPTAPARYVRGALAVPERALDNLLVAGKGDEIAQAERDRFAEARFASWPDIPVAAQLRDLMEDAQGGGFAVLGDMPLLYTLFDQPPPYHVQNYDSGRIEEQEVVVDHLRDSRPRFLVWRRDFAMDLVPQSVRSPLIFRYAIENFVPIPLARGAAVDILERREVGEPIAEEYWKDRLGEVVDLGFVPSISAADEAALCTGGAGCVPYAVLEGSAAERGASIDLRIIGSDGTFTVRMRARPGVTTYPVRLDRLWFAPFIGDDPRVEAATPGWNARREGRRTDDDLY
jgi:hypothetical protein